MEELKNNKIYKFLFLFFIFVSIVHIGYAAITARGLYLDGSFYCLTLLDNISNDSFKFIFDTSHPRHFITILMELPLVISGLIFNIENKLLLIGIYSCTQFLLPFLALLWNFNLTKRTGRIDVLFWNIFAYGILLLPFSIFSVVEILLGATFHFILWNYLVSNIKYTKKDIVYIIFLIIVMHATYEYVTLLGLIFFTAHFHYVLNPKISLKEQCVKSLIGIGSLSASIYNIWYMFSVPGEGGEVLRFIGEATSFFSQIIDLNTCFSILTILLLFIFIFIKKKISLITFSIIGLLYTCILIKLLITQQLSVNPVIEGHLRTIPCWALQLIFVAMTLKDLISKEINLAKYSNYIVIVLTVCIFQTIWQCVNTYYWDKNIQYMKNELNKENSYLYIPSKHEKISNFYNEELRRYIWHYSYSALSILLSSEYNQKTLLLLYDTQVEEGNNFDRKALFTSLKDNKISIPLGSYIDIKNKFWDLTNVAKALDDYNKENNIETYR